MVIVTFDPRDALFLQKEQRFKHYATFVCECFTPLLIATKKILAKHSENPLEMFSTCVFNLHRFMESRISADAVCHFSRINCTLGQQIRRWTFKQRVWNVCATRLGSIVRDANCYPHKLEVLCVKLHYSHSLCVLLTLLRLTHSLTDWLTHWLTDWLIVFWRQYLCLFYTFAISFATSESQILWAEILNFFEYISNFWKRRWKIGSLSKIFIIIPRWNVSKRNKIRRENWKFLRNVYSEILLNVL